ncbi:23S rRNA (adenine(1618)-N(6))-methyltransferase RlmF [Chitinibacter bivalviorum]|uniref:Ribosomal RNA large subunit methyltransferase F n=1 Tax=Chitinibacter bivalviorum TaxID=2739434 RepID=A0A7H9BK64_9NEIS|nr:23S rRNA (adenine(1618)-N(6))-methyltransferase RlmF [Chitinibacter bivalviorum]QLG88963.1 23S rRNA (adenine(1618)-N(6))-methyltransferase RlmF [Chitinibacter bivalviorum]
MSKFAPKKTATIKAPKAANKASLHSRNQHQGRYDFAALIAASSELAQFVAKNAYGDDSIDFADPQAVKALNRALLAHFYGITTWDTPEGYLCPPIPGRADYIHTLADLLASETGEIPRGDAVRGLDIGVGANAIYPMLGRASYGWHFVGSDIDPVAVKNAAQIFANNAVLAGGLDARLQSATRHIFNGIIGADEYFDFTLCNPPFHASAADAAAGSNRKLRNLGLANKADKTPKLNFAGQNNELWCEGGEVKFITQMILESKHFATQVGWFTTLVSKIDNLPPIYKALRGVGAHDVKTLDMAQGQKISRIVAWRFSISKN